MLARRPGQPAAAGSERQHARPRSCCIRQAGANVAASAAESQQQQQQQQQQQLQALRQLYPEAQVQRLVEGNPQVLALPVADWARFFQGYGLSRDATWRVLRYAGAPLAASDPYTAGAALLWLKQLGPWSDADLAARLIPCYPGVLARSADDLQALVDELAGLGLEPALVQQLLWECPGLFSDFREEQMPLLAAMVARRRSKYTKGASYAD